MFLDAYPDAWACGLYHRERLAFCRIAPWMSFHEYNGSSGISLMMRPFVRSR